MSETLRGPVLLAALMCDDVVADRYRSDYLGVRTEFEVPPGGELPLTGYLVLRFALWRGPAKFRITARLFDTSGPHVSAPFLQDVWVRVRSWDSGARCHMQLRGTSVREGAYYWEIRVDDALVAVVPFSVNPTPR